jgi:hypothetical protein
MRIQLSKLGRPLAVVVLAAMLLVALVAPMVMAQGEPQAGTVSGVTTYTYYPTTALTGSGTAYSAAPRTVSGQDLSRAVKYYNAMDVFVTVDLITSTGTITVTPQFSADQANWANAYYTYPTWTDSATATINTQTYQVVLTADGTNYIKVPVSGEYFRVKIEYAGTTLTPTVKATLRNN